MILGFQGNGGDVLLAGLNAMEKGADEKACMKALRAGGKVLADAMKSRIRRKSGATAESIKVKRARVAGGDGVFGVVVGATGEHAHVGRLLETGHISPHGKHIPAYPWARPAWDSSESSVRSAVFETLFDEIRRAREGA